MVSSSIRGVKHCDFSAGFDPRIQPAFERPHAAQALIHQQAGDTRRAGFARSTAIDNNVVFGRDVTDVVFGRGNIHRHRTGNMARIDFARSG